MSQVSAADIDKAFAAPPADAGAMVPATMTNAGTLAPVRPQRSPIAVQGGRIVPKSFDEVGRLAMMMVDGDCIPPSFWGSRNNPRNREQCLAAVTVSILKGLRHGMDPFEAVQCMYVINNVPRFWGKAVPGIVRGDLRARGERIVETTEHKGDGEARTCTVTVVHLNKDGEEIGKVARSFSMKNAKDQGLLGKDTWKHSADRMLMHRARTYCYDDLFPDLMMGIGDSAEVDEDYEVLEDRRQRVTLDQALSAAKPRCCLSA